MASQGAPSMSSGTTSPTPTRKNVFKSLTRSFSAKASKTAMVSTTTDELTVPKASRQVQVMHHTHTRTHTRTHTHTHTHPHTRARARAQGSNLKKSNSLKEEYVPTAPPSNTSPSMTRKSSLSRLQFGRGATRGRSRSASPSNQSPLRISPGHSPSAMRRPALRAGTCGQIEVSFFYITHEEVLHITLHKLRDFPGIDPAAPLDMCVVFLPQA
jgi:hypothetical protein